MTQLRKLFGGYLMLVPAFLAVPDLKREEGQTLAEYALILALIAVVVVRGRCDARWHDQRSLHERPATRSSSVPASRSTAAFGAPPSSSY